MVKSGFCGGQDIGWRRKIGIAVGGITVAAAVTISAVAILALATQRCHGSLVEQSIEKIAWSEKGVVGTFAGIFARILVSALVSFVHCIVPIVRRLYSGDSVGKRRTGSDGGDGGGGVAVGRRRTKIGSIWMSPIVTVAAAAAAVALISRRSIVVRW